LLKNLKRVLLVVGVFLLMLAFPLTASAAPAITSLTMDRTTVTAGQSVTFSVRTTSQAQFAFAMVDGLRTQGTRVSTDAAGNHNWSITVTPSRTTTVVVFANTSNTEAGAASFSIPITVSGTTPVTPGTPGTPGTPNPPFQGNLGALDIGSISETPATSQGMVQLTVITGPEANYVWVRFDETSYVRGTMISQNPGSRTWTIDFRPRSWTPLAVQVGANTVYNYTGATLQTFNVTLTQPFQPATDAVIQSVVPTPREVNPGGQVTLRITTNANVNAVWVRDIDGWEHNARNIAPNTTTTRTWEVSLRPARTGPVTVFANATRTSVGAVQHSETLTVRGSGVSIIETRATRTGGAHDATIVRVTTNRDAESVWVVNNNNIIPLSHIAGFGTAGNRTWEVEFVGPVFPMQVRASAHPNRVGVDAEFTINNWGNWQGGGHFPGDNIPGDGSFGWGRVNEITFPWHQELRRSGSTTAREATIHVITHGNVDEVRVVGSNISLTRVDNEWVGTGGTREWLVTFRINSNTPLGWRNFEVEARYNNGRVGGGETPEIRVFN